MSNKIMLFIGCLLLAFGLHAQDDVPILLTKSDKKVKYAPGQGEKFSKVSAVKSLDAGGVLKLSRKSSARLYCNGSFKELEGKGEYTIADLFQDELKYTPMGFSNTFNGMLMAAIGGPRGSDTTSSSSGWGNKKFEIAGETPIGKTTANQSITFRWRSREVLPAYEFVIGDESGKVVHAATVNEKKYALELGSLGLNTGKKYFWKVQAPGGEGASSGKYSFTIADEGEQAAAMEGLQEEEAYKKADPLIRKLMEAASLEEAEFYYAAGQAYEEATKMSDKGDLPKNMREAFSRRRQN
ncbi:MAG: hypothetical protein H6558_20295 [Lewinellaceae bacterium]|nr:hypothetical protein [Lewinellaceae bacterium]